MPRLTKTEAAVLDFIRQTLIKKTMPPTVREIGAHFGWSSPAWPGQVLRSLHKKKQIEFNPRVSRGINITDEWSTLLRVIARLPIEDLRRVVRECT